MDIISYLLGKKAGGGGGTVNLETKEVTITTNTTTEITPSVGYDGLSKVTVTTNVPSGGGGIDWSAIGYTETPEAITSGYEYSISIQNNWNSSQTSGANKFQNDMNLEYMPLVNTSKLNRCDNMFDGCSYLQQIPQLNLSAISLGTGLTYTFRNCIALEKVDLSNVNTSQITSLKSTFNVCKKLKELDLSTWTAPSLTSMNNTFDGCQSLQKLDIRKLELTNVNNYTNVFSSIPANCLIIVKDENNKNWVLARRSDFTNVKTVAEYESR